VKILFIYLFIYFLIEKILKAEGVVVAGDVMQ
jgi:hypothetical protein